MYRLEVNDNTAQVGRNNDRGVPAWNFGDALQRFWIGFVGDEELLRTGFEACSRWGRVFGVSERENLTRR